MSIDELKQAIQGDTPIEYSAHCLKRMLERGITRNDDYSDAMKSQVR